MDKKIVVFENGVKVEEATTGVKKVKLDRTMNRDEMNKIIQDKQDAKENL